MKLFGKTRPLEPINVSSPSSAAQPRSLSGGKASIAGRSLSAPRPVTLKKSLKRLRMGEIEAASSRKQEFARRTRTRVMDHDASPRERHRLGRHQPRRPCANDETAPLVREWSPPSSPRLQKPAPAHSIAFVREAGALYRRRRPFSRAGQPMVPQALIQLARPSDLPRGGVFRRDGAAKVHRARRSNQTLGTLRRSAPRSAFDRLRTLIHQYSHAKARRRNASPSVRTTSPCATTTCSGCLSIRARILGRALAR